MEVSQCLNKPLLKIVKRNETQSSIMMKWVFSLTQNTYLSIYLSIFLSTYLASYLPTYLPTYLPACLPACLLPILFQFWKIPPWFPYKVQNVKNRINDQQFIKSKVLDGKVQKYLPYNLPYNGVFPGKITTKSCKLGTSIKASVTRFAALSLSLAILWKWQPPNLIPIFPLNIKIKLFYYSINN